MSDRPLPSSFDAEPEFFEETRWQKFTRRLKQEPLIPLGAGATCFALYRAYKSMKARDSLELNRMFRARIYAQAFTLVCICAGGLYYKEERQARRKFEQALDEKKSQEKRDAWLRELEIRDKEDRDWRERHEAIGRAAEAAEKAGRPGGKEVIKESDVKSVVEPELEEGRVVSAVKALIGRR